MSAETAKLELSTTITRNENIVFTDLDDTIVMMDVDEGQYYELDPVAARIWEIVEESPTVSGICSALAAEYAVEPQECQEGTLEFLQSAAEQGIVHAE